MTSSAFFDEHNRKVFPAVSSKQRFKEDSFGGSKMTAGVDALQVFMRPAKMRCY